MTRADLVPCPPMHARISVTACVRIYESGEQCSCSDCGLGLERGASADWHPTKPKLVRIGLANHYGPGSLGGKAR